ncbi:bifunctional diguanylate cyclase/phosphodiesterase [Acetobacterium woodii]|nr:EAL domain-containing protein [Acetobacterium woodii]
MEIKNKQTKQRLEYFIMIFVPGLLIVVLFAVGFININIDNNKNIIKIRQSNSGAIVSVNVNSIFEDINSDGNIILNSSEMKDYVGNSVKATNSDELKRIFSNMMANKKIYDSIRFIGNDGYEQIRVNATTNGTFAIPDNALDYKGDYDYFQEGIKLNSGEIYIAPMDLMVDNEHPEIPIKPVIRVVSPIFNEKNEKVGILVLNYLAQNMLNQIESDSKNDIDTKIMLLNENGHYLLNENSNKDYLFMDEDGKVGSFSQDKPEIWQAILKNGLGNFDDGKELYYYTSIYPFEGYQNLHWILVSATSLESLGLFTNEDNRTIVFIAALLIFMIAIIGLVGSWLLLIKKEANSREKITDRIFKNSKEGIMIMDAKMQIIYINKAFLTITGYQEDEVMGKKPIDLKVSENLKAVYKGIWEMVNEEGNWQGEIIDEKKDGTQYPKYITISQIFDSKSDALSNYLEVFEDLTSIKKTEEAINIIKHYDEVTGLPTQVLFEKKIHEVMKQYDQLAIVVLQITNFNSLYDNLGKKSGNILMKEASRRIQALLSGADYLGSILKDQFVFARINSADKLKIGHLMNKMITDLREPIEVENEKVYLNVSIGIALFQEDSADLEKLIEYGNIAKNYAHQAGDNTYVFYEKEIKANYLSNLKLETELRSALEKNELSLNYQPQVEIDTAEIIATEALLRWNNAELGKVNPDQFIPVAERTDLIIPIGNWVLEEAIKQNKKWQSISRHPLAVSVNLSPIQLKKTDLPQMIAELLKKYEMPAELLEIEITEGILVDNMEGISSQLEKIKTLGVKVAIDDFGMGYSSLKYLRNLNFDKLKIDREFIKDYPEKDNGNIAKMMINLAEQMDLKVIAEGVETAEQLLFLKENNCRVIQGYYFYKPLSVDEFEKLMAKTVSQSAFQMISQEKD